MSLTITPQILAAARAGNVELDDFLEVVSVSLPKAWPLVREMIYRKVENKFHDDNTLVEYSPGEMDSETRGELLRIMASNAIRGAIERRFRVRLAFRNCHAIACFSPSERREFAVWTSIENQILHQSPELVHC